MNEVILNFRVEATESYSDIARAASYCAQGSVYRYKLNNMHTCIFAKMCADDIKVYVRVYKYEASFLLQVYPNKILK